MGTSTVKDWFSHAFALRESDTEGLKLPRSLENFAALVVSKKMEIPAILFLETIGPLNFLGSQLLHAAGPLGSLFSTEDDLREVAEALEKRGTLPVLVARIEELSSKGIS